MSHDFQRNLRHNPPGDKSRNNVAHSTESLPAKLHMDHKLHERQEENIQRWPDEEFSSSDSEYDIPIDDDMYEDPCSDKKTPFCVPKQNTAGKPYTVTTAWDNTQPGHEVFDTADDSYIDPNQPPQVTRTTKPNQPYNGKGRGIVPSDQSRPPLFQSQDFRPPVPLSSHPASNVVSPSQGFMPTMTKQDLHAGRKGCNPAPNNPKLPKKPQIPRGNLKSSHSDIPPPLLERDRPKIVQTPGYKSGQARANTQPNKIDESSAYEVMTEIKEKKTQFSSQLPAPVLPRAEKVKLKPTNGPIKNSDVSPQVLPSATQALNKNGRLALTDALNNRLKLRNKNDLDSQVWYTNTCDRPKAVKALEKNGKNGAFLVRKSAQASRDQPYTLSLLYKGTVYNLRIRWMEDAAKYALGNEKEGEETFDSVVEMIENYQKSSLNLISSQQGEINQCKLEYPVNIS